MSEDFDLSGYTLFERQSLFFNGVRCPYCFGYSDLVDSTVIHQEFHGLIYFCKVCDSAVGTVMGDKSLGVLAKKELRDQRRYCHKLLDEIIDKKVSFKKIKPRTARIRMYKWVAELLGITKIECHTAYWNLSQCKKVIDECKKYLN